MARLRKFLLLTVAGVAAVTAGLAVNSYLRGRESGPPMPDGIAEPCFAGRLLLSPRGAVWRLVEDIKSERSEISIERFLPGDDWVAISGSQDRGLAVRKDGALWGWNSTMFGAGIGDVGTELGTDRDWVDVRNSVWGTVAVSKDGSLWEWTPKPVTSLDIDRPPKLEGNLRKISSPTIKYGGGLFRSTPKRPVVGAGPEWTSVSASLFGSVALRNDGTVWVDGANSRSMAPDFYPGTWTSGAFQVGTDTDWVRAIAGVDCFVAQKKDGSWWGSGDNHFSHLGIPHWFGHTRHLKKPTRIPLKFEAVAWSIEQNTTLLLSRRGNVYYMGRRPGSGRKPAKFGHWLNKTITKIPGVPPLIPRPGEDWSDTPVKIGPLPGL